MTNAVQHAYPDAVTPGAVTITGDASDALLIIHVIDRGAGMRPRPDSPGLGLGLPLISQMTQSFEVHEPSGGGTALCMRFDLSRGQL
jgi:anti-sigma regulatory factor (Ser/Thr protein kinase)